jgi:Tn3 transposase DDE domain
LRRYLLAAAPSDGEDQSRRLDVDRYEFLAYRLLRNILDAGNVFVGDSTQFRRFEDEDDLISDGRWKNKDAVLREIGAPILIRPNRRNTGASPRGVGKEVCPRQATRRERCQPPHQGARRRRQTALDPGLSSEEEPINSPFFGELPPIGIADLLWFVHEETNFLSAFTHVLDRHVKHDPAGHEVLACLIAFGTNMGLSKMAAASTSIIPR